MDPVAQQHQTQPQPHPFHDDTPKHIHHHMTDWGVPIGLFLLYFFFYNFGKVTMSEMIKTSGLLAIALLSVTLVVGPLSRFIHHCNNLKINRKFWGIAAFLVAVVHGSLSIISYGVSETKLLGFVFGLIATVILLLVTVSSHKSIIHKLHPGVWKRLQTASYLALLLAVGHFFFMEQKEGVLVIKRLAGQITFWFASVVLLIRLIVYLFPKKATPTKIS